jgi:hypothetical protein
MNKESVENKLYSITFRPVKKGKLALNSISHQKWMTRNL